MARLSLSAGGGFWTPAPMAAQQSRGVISALSPLTAMRPIPHPLAIHRREAEPYR